MTELLEKAVDAVRRMTAAEQDAIADAMLSMARIGTPQGIDPDHLQDVLDGFAEIARGEIASDEEVEAAFRSFERRRFVFPSGRRSDCGRSRPI